MSLKVQTMALWAALSAAAAGAAGPSVAQSATQGAAGAGGVAGGITAGSSAVDPEVSAIATAMHLREVFAIMRDEGVRYGTALEDDMFTGRGGAGWAADVARIYSADRTYPLILKRLSDALAGAPELPAIRSFLDSDLARRAIALEVSGRRAFLDDSVGDAARVRVDEMAATGDPRLQLVERFIAENDLLESNVASGLNAARAFYTGLQEGGAFVTDMSEDDILRDVWAQEGEIRAQSGSWLTALLVLSYAPLSDADLKSYIGFSRSPAGHRLNRALFEAYDDVFVDLSHQLGRAAAKYIAGQTL